MKAYEVPMPVRIGVTAALAAATTAGATVPKDSTIKTGAGVVGTLATIAYAWWAFKDEVTAETPYANDSANDNKNLLAAGVGVGATAAIGAAMYFLSGKEMPKLPKFGATDSTEDGV